jgi:hypothetical protein
VIGVPALLLAIYVVVRDATQVARSLNAEDARLVSEPEIDPSVSRQRTIAIVAWMVGFFAAIWLFGFIAAAAVATFLYLKFGAGEKWPISLSLTAAAWLFFFGLFDYGLQLPFPTGAIFDLVSVNFAAIHITP